MTSFDIRKNTSKFISKFFTNNTVMSGTSGPTVKQLIHTSLSFAVPPTKSAMTTSTSSKQNVLLATLWNLVGIGA